MIEAATATPVTPRRSPIAAGLGVLSVALLGASLRWAHHWGLLADTIVAAWVVATLGALVFSVLLLTSNVTWLTYAGSVSRRSAWRVASSRSSRLRWPASPSPPGDNVAGACGGG